MMKFKHILIVLFIFFFVVDAQAQQYEPPSREQVQRLLDELEECKNILDEAQVNLKDMEDNPEQVTLKDYQDTQQLIKNAKGCIADRRKKLDELRKEYPGWFNSPSVSVILDKGHSINPKELERLHKKIEDIIVSVNKRIAAITPPE